MADLALALALLAIAALERVPAARSLPLPLWRRSSGSDLACLATGAIALGLVLRSLAIAAGVAAPGVRAALDSLPAPARLLAALLAYDLGAFASHWLLHRVPALWRLHQVHHSSPALDWLATFRAHLAEHALRHLLSPVALLLAGFPLAVVAAATAIHTAWSALGHANVGLRLRWLEPWLVTPRLHRLHHVATSGDHNLGTFLTLWDRLRGKWLRAPEAALAPLGVPGRLGSYPEGWLGQQLEPFRTPRPA